MDKLKWKLRRLWDVLRQVSPGACVAALLCVISAAAVCGMLLFLTVWGGNPAHRAYTDAAPEALMGEYEMFIEDQVSNALDGVMNVKKKYWIDYSQKKGPKPNRKCYGKTDDPAKMEKVIAQAAELLEGQELYFTTDVELFPDSEFEYYLDETIFSVTWKRLIDGCAYTFAEVKIADASQFRRFLAGGEFGTDKYYTTTDMASSVNAVLATSGDFYSHRKAGVLVYDHTVQRINNGLVDTCYIDRKGDLHFTRVNDRVTMEEAEKYVEENDIQFSLAFGPVLIIDGEPITTQKYYVGEITDKYPRSALCQMDTLHYLIVNANHEDPYYNVPNLAQFAKHLQETGCRHAYTLDGGQTAVIALDGRMINRVMFGFQRKISDIIYFATAIPNNKR